MKTFLYCLYSVFSIAAVSFVATSDDSLPPPPAEPLRLTENKALHDEFNRHFNATRANNDRAHQNIEEIKLYQTKINRIHD